MGGTDKVKRAVFTIAIAAGTLIAAPAAHASTCYAWSPGQPPNAGVGANRLEGVDLVGTCDGWAVGTYYDGSRDATLIERWDGSAWTVVPSPNTGSYANTLRDVKATSSTNAWAVGQYSTDGSIFKTLILRWNGTAWKRQRSPSPSATWSQLFDVAATSATNAWAVGQYFDGVGNAKTLILHWDGESWTRQKSPNLQSPNNNLQGVGATSATNAWAVGGANGSFRPFILHWNGVKWSIAKTPNLGSNSLLGDVAFTSATSGWAAGTEYPTTGRRTTLLLHWNGSAWKRQTSPNAKGNNDLYDIAATSATNAWAVGDSGNALIRNLVLHWDGTGWKIVKTPNVGSGDNELQSVDLAGPTYLWTVGDYDGPPQQTLALHCC